MDGYHKVVRPHTHTKRDREREREREREEYLHRRLVQRTEVSLTHNLSASTSLRRIATFCSGALVIGTHLLTRLFTYLQN